MSILQDIIHVQTHTSERLYHSCNNVKFLSDKMIPYFHPIYIMRMSSSHNKLFRQHDFMFSSNIIIASNIEHDIDPLANSYLPVPSNTHEQVF